MSHKKHDMPLWFPFALLASGLVALGAGLKSNWGRAKAPVEPQQEPPLQQAGMLKDWHGTGAFS